jgi:hypothetical protein
MAATPTESVTCPCTQTNPATGYTVLTYDATPSAPTKPSTDCATTLAALLADGLINVNISVQRTLGPLVQAHPMAQTGPISPT